jgi:GNAT superfamily N-acetyltransferase
MFWTKGTVGMTTTAVASTDEEIKSCFAVMSELRPHLRADTFVGLVRHMEGEGYRLAFIEESGTVVAVAGYRIFTNLVVGKNLYVDDLVTAEAHRSKGYGELMLGWLRNVAKEAGCAHFHLDSGTQRHRAHRFYLRQGFDIMSFHFGQRIAPEMPEAF